MPKIFLDTNIILYAFTDDPPSVVAETLLARGADLSVQVLNEFAIMARRKLGFDWQQVEQALQAIRLLARTTTLSIWTPIQAHWTWRSAISCLSMMP